MGWEDDTFSPPNMRGFRLTIFTQLRQAIEAMHHPEEVFQWLTSMIMQRFDVPIVQLWTCENGWTDQLSARLWAMASQNPSQPLYTMSEKVAATVERISKGQSISVPQPVERMFPAYVASLLKRYGLSYCIYCLVARNVDFAPEEYVHSYQRPSTGFTFIVLLFLQQNPRQELISSINIILEQALVIAENHHLLLPVATTAGQITSSQAALAQEPPPALPRLILRKKQDAGLMLSSNPFASSITISDKQALRLYEVIDGHKAVAELSSSAGMTLKEAQLAIQGLLSLQCIEIYTPEGWPVDAALLFKDH